MSPRDHKRGGEDVGTPLNLDWAASLAQSHNLRADQPHYSRTPKNTSYGTLHAVPCVAMNDFKAVSAARGRVRVAGEGGLLPACLTFSRLTSDASRLPGFGYFQQIDT